MDVTRMGHRPGYYEIALKQQRRRQVEKTLTCPECGKQNKPGASYIDVDETDDARCPCGHIWAVYVA